MKKILMLSFSILFSLGSIGVASAITIVDTGTSGYYNDSIGYSLNLTNPYGDTYLFPGDYRTYGDPTIGPVLPEPVLSNAAGVLGNWLTDPANLGPDWSGPQSIPTTWTVNTETAIIYEIDAGTGFAYDNVFASFGVDNGIFVWLDGEYIYGVLRPGGASLGEHTIDIGSLSAGTHYLQILREDHGGATGYGVSITGDVATAPVPEPATMLLLGSGIVGLAGFRRKFKKS